MDWKDSKYFAVGLFNSNNHGWIIDVLSHLFQIEELANLILYRLLRGFELFIQMKELANLILYHLTKKNKKNK